MTLVARIGSIGTLLAALFVAPAALEAQAGPGDRRPPSRFDEARDSVPVNARSAWVFGVTTFTRGEYQPSGVDATLAFRTSGLPFKAVGIGLRAGSFTQNQAVAFGRSKGYFAAVVANVRRPLFTLAAVGSGDAPTLIKLELILEGVASLAADSPMPQGNVGGIFAPLLAISLGNGGVLDQGQSLIVGPAWFVGKTVEWHPQVSFRFQLPRRR